MSATPIALSNGLTVSFSNIFNNTEHFPSCWGYTDNDAFAISVTPTDTSFITEEAGLQNYDASNAGVADGQFSLSLIPINTANTTIAKNVYRRYKISIIYDGVQESLLSGDYVGLSEYNFLDTVNSYESIQVLLLAKGGSLSPSSFNKRITAVNIYCAVSGDDNPANLGIYHLLGTAYMGTADDWTNKFYLADGATASGSFGSSTVFTPDTKGVDKLAGFYDKNAGGVSYEANTGI